MNLKKFLVLFLITLLLSPLVGSDKKSTPPQEGPGKKPEAPKGFEWKRCEEAKINLLIPDGWHYKEQKAEGTLAYFVTKEKIEKENGRFQTGLSINVIAKSHLRTKVPPSSYAEKFITHISLDKDKEILQKSAKPMGPFKAFLCRFRSLNKENSVTVHYFIIANDKTGALFLFSFESPTNEWDNAWLIGEKLLTFLSIDDEF